jgi:hypothetical protein
VAGALHHRHPAGQRDPATFALALKLNILVAIAAAVAAGLLAEAAERSLRRARAHTPGGGA